MIIFQPDRFLTRKSIKNSAHYISGRVLDAGSGSYSRYEHLFKYNEYLSLDIDKNLNPDIVGSVDNMPIADNSFDSVVCNAVIGDILYPENVIKEINRVLKINGHCLLTDNFFAFIHNRPYDYYRFTDIYLKKIFSENGFEILRCEKIGGFFAMMAQSTIKYFILRFNLYEHKYISKIIGKLFGFFGRFMIFLDKHDKSVGNNDVGIGWLIVAKKKSNIKND